MSKTSCRLCTWQVVVATDLTDSDLSDSDSTDLSVVSVVTVVTVVTDSTDFLECFRIDHMYSCSYSRELFIKHEKVACNATCLHNGRVGSCLLFHRISNAFLR